MQYGDYIRERQQVVGVVLGLVAAHRLAPRAADVKLSVHLQHTLPRVRLVAAVAGQTGWEGTMPRLDGVVSVVDSDDHVLPLFRC